MAALALAWAAIVAFPAAAAAPAKPILVRMVIVTAFEIGEDRRDRAGEYQAWAETMPQFLPFPAGFRHLGYDPARQVLLLSTGIGTNRAAASVMALGLDPRFDLSKAYWMVAAIAGTNPDEASVGSAAWIGDVIDTDYAYAIDPREAPKDWTAGILPRGRDRPYETPAPADRSYNLFPLNKALRDWAYRLTADIALPDPPVLAQIRAAYAGFPKAVLPPRVIVGDEATGQTFWHGALFNTHVEKWVGYWTGGKGRFVMTAMEDSGVVGALGMLGRIGKADPRRALVLRTGSNYSVQPNGMGAADSLVAEGKLLSALQPSLDAAFLVGGRVVEEITGHWDAYADHVPGDEPAGVAARQQ
jgi:purine nucleoside permease